MMKRASRDGTKRDMIAKMLLDADRNLSVEQIARELGTSKGNVWKEKSILRSMGILEKHDIGVYSGTAEGDTIALARSETKMLVHQTNYGSLVEIPPLGKEELKQLYSEFKRGRSFGGTCGTRVSPLFSRVRVQTLHQVEQSGHSCST